MTAPLLDTTEVTGPIATKLFVSSATDDADLFVVVRVLNPELKEVTFQGHTTIRTPLSRKAGCERRIANSIRNGLCPTGPITRTMKFRS